MVSSKKTGILRAAARAVESVEKNGDDGNDLVSGTESNAGDDYVASGDDDDERTAKENLVASAKEVAEEDHDEYGDDQYEQDEDAEPAEEVKKTSDLVRTVQEMDEEIQEKRVKSRSAKPLVEVVREMDEEEREAAVANDSGEEEEEEEEEEEDGFPPLDEESNRKLLRLAFHGRVKQAKELLTSRETEERQSKLSVNGGDKHGWTPLIWAASRGHVEFCEMLLGRGALVNKQEKTNGWTALHLAAINSHIDVAELLLSHKASRRRVDLWGDIPHECAPRPIKGARGNEAKHLRKILRPHLGRKEKEVDKENERQQE